MFEIWRRKKKPEEPVKQGAAEAPEKKTDPARPRISAEVSAPLPTGDTRPLFHQKLPTGRVSTTEDSCVGKRLRASRLFMGVS